MCGMVTQCDVTQVTEFKVGLMTKLFRSSVFCGGEELLLLPSLNFLPFKLFHIQKNLYNTLKERKIYIYDRSPLM